MVPTAWVLVVLVVAVLVLTPAPPLADVPAPLRLVPPLAVVVEAPAVLEAALEAELALELEAEFTAGFEPALELPEVPFDVKLVVEVDFVAVVTVAGDAALVVGIVSVGAPAVSLEPLPLPPQAASTRAASTAAAPERVTRNCRLRTGSCI